MKKLRTNKNLRIAISILFVLAAFFISGCTDNQTEAQLLSWITVLIVAGAGIGIFFKDAH